MSKRLGIILSMIILTGFAFQLPAQLKYWSFPNTYIAPKQNKQEKQKDYKPKFSLELIRDWGERYHVFDNIELGATLGTSGLGLEFGTPVTKWTRLRVGFDWVPPLHVPMEFDLNTYSTDGLPSDNFFHLQEMLYNLTGIEMDQEVNMIGKPEMINLKVLIDVFPFQNNRKWHFTAGFYLGSTSIAKAYNTRVEKPTLVALNIYNRAFNYFNNLQSIFDVPLGGGLYLDPEVVLDLQERFRRYGELGIHVGDFKDGTPYIMMPAPDGSLRAKAFVNRFKPYVGFGYSGNLDKTGKWKIGIEAGAMFWGGVPDVYDQNGINMTKDLVNIGGKVGDYISIIKALPVYPIIDLRISYSFF